MYLIQFQCSHYFRLSHFQMPVAHLWMPQEMVHVTHNLNVKIRVAPKVATVLQGNQLKFVFFEKATKFDELFILFLTNKFVFLCFPPNFEFSVSYSSSLSDAL